MSAGWADLDLRPVPGEPGRFTTTISPTWQLAVEHPDGMLDVAGPIVLRDTMPSSVGQKLGPDTGPWFAPSVDYTLHVFGPLTPPPTPPQANPRSFFLGNRQL